MDRGAASALAVIGVVFGIMAGLTAFINACEGYSHFPSIPREKRIIMSLEYAVGAFCMSVLAVGLVYLFIWKFYG
jgi:hypothetical protein